MKYHILTYGCQMNFAESGILSSRLQQAGHLPTERLDEAEIVLVNTCCVRATAEDRAYGRLLSLKPQKQNGSLKVLGVCGCLAQQDAENMLERVPHLDLVVGTRALDRLVNHVSLLISGSEPIVDVGEGPALKPPEDDVGANANTHSVAGGEQYPVFVSITRGCNNRCAYCVVPGVRGGLESLNSGDIMRQVCSLVDSGYKEVTLIGQNVNVYREDGLNFAGMLRRVHEIDGLKRIRFVTSHPKDLTDEIIDAVAELPKVCEYFHMPLQAGSDRILKMMRRGYTVDHYRRLVEKIRERVLPSPGSGSVAISTDLIVGFPGETNEDFQATLKCVEDIRWDGAYMFMYSARKGIEAETLPNKVSREVKLARLQELIALQKEISLCINRERVGTTEEVMVESSRLESHSDNSPGVSSKAEFWRTRTRNSKLVYVRKREPIRNLSAGDYLRVHITQARAYTLFGEVVTDSGA